MQATSSSSTADSALGDYLATRQESTLRTLSKPETLELWLLQLGLMLLGTYFAMGVVTKQTYAWPLLMGSGPFFPLLCLYLGCQLQRRTPHLYAMVRVVTVYSVPFATIALVRGYLMEDAADQRLHAGHLPPLLLAITLGLRLRAWRRLFDAPYEGGTDEGGALLTELFAGAGAWCLVLCGISYVGPVSDWARTLGSSNDFIRSGAYTLGLCRLMLVPALAAAAIGAYLYRSRASSRAMSVALAFVVIMTLIHVAMLTFFAHDVWSAVSGATWSLVLVGFCVHLFRLWRARLILGSISQMRC